MALAAATAVAEGGGLDLVSSASEIVEDEFPIVAVVKLAIFERLPLTSCVFRISLRAGDGSGETE